jgi:hypothetical protein
MEVLWSLGTGTNQIELRRGERAFDLYGFALEEANRSGRLRLTSIPCFLFRGGS